MNSSSQDTRPRIGVIMPLGHQQGGAEALLMHWLRHGSEKYALHCAFLQPGPLVDLAADLGYPTVVFPATRLTDAGNYLQTVRRLRRWIKKEKLAAAFSWMAKAQLYVAPVCLGTGVRTFWYQHGMPRPYGMNRLMAHIPTDRIFCCSKASKEAQDFLSRAGRATVCYPGVFFPNDAPPTQAEARARLNLPLDRPLVGMVARLERWKGIHVFIDAARRSADSAPDALFFVAGGVHPRDPACAEELRAQVATCGLEDRFRFLGQISSEEVPLWQAACDLIVHPVTGEEAFGMAVAEAMGMGRVVIASNTAGPGEMIADGVNGFLVPPGDVTALSEQIDQLLADPARIRSIEPIAFTRGRSFSIPRFAARLDELIAETLRLERH